VGSGLARNPVSTRVALERRLQFSRVGAHASRVDCSVIRRRCRACELRPPWSVLLAGFLRPHPLDPIIAYCTLPRWACGLRRAALLSSRHVDSTVRLLLLGHHDSAVVSFVVTPDTIHMESTWRLSTRTTFLSRCPFRDAKVRCDVLSLVFTDFLQLCNTHPVPSLVCCSGTYPHGVVQLYQLGVVPTLLAESLPIFTGSGVVTLSCSATSGNTPASRSSVRAIWTLDCPSTDVPLRQLILLSFLDATRVFEVRCFSSRWLLLHRARRGYP